MRIIFLSECSNLTWYHGFEEWVKRERSNEPYNHLNEIISKFNYKKCCLKNVTTYAKILSIIIIVFWIVMIFLKNRII